MRKSAVEANRGLFDRSSKSKSIGPVTLQIERGRIRFFAQVLGETDPIHWDVAAARHQGHPDLVAPPSFFMVIEAMANEELLHRGVAPVSKLIGCDFRYLTSSHAAAPSLSAFSTTVRSAPASQSSRPHKTEGTR